MLFNRKNDRQSFDKGRQDTTRRMTCLMLRFAFGTIVNAGDFSYELPRYTILFQRKDANPNRRPVPAGREGWDFFPVSGEIKDMIRQLKDTVNPDALLLVDMQKQTVRRINDKGRAIGAKRSLVRMFDSGDLQRLTRLVKLTLKTGDNMNGPAAAWKVPNFIVEEYDSLGPYACMNIQQANARAAENGDAHTLHDLVSGEAFEPKRTVAWVKLS